MGLVARSRGDCERAAARLEESLALRRERGDERSVAASLGFLGLVALDQGEYERAEGLLEESLALLQGSGVTWDIPFALVGLGHAVLRRNEYERAAALLREGLQVQWAMGDAQYLGWCLEGLAAVAWAHGLPVRAARLCGAADALRRELPGESPADRAAHQRTVMAARAALGDEDFATAWAAGRALLPEQLIDEALHDGP